MNLLTRFCRWWLGVKEAPVSLPVQPYEDLQMAVQHGIAIGELRGRNAAITELETMLANCHRLQVEPEDVTMLKIRTFH